MEDIDLNNYSYKQIMNLIYLSLDYFDYNEDNFEDKINNFISNNSINDKQNINKSSAKNIVCYLIDILKINIDNPNKEKSVVQSLSKINMPEKLIKEFLELKNNSSSNINNFHVLSNKLIFNNNRLIDFKYSFIINYADSINRNSENQNIDFKVKLDFKYINDEGSVELFSTELTIIQFYYLLNEFKKINTVLHTLE